MRRLGGSAALLLGLAFALPAIGSPPPPGPTGATGEAVGLPYTIERVWFRKGSRRTLGGGSISGDLTVTAEALELIGRKQTQVIPIRSIRQLSFGKLRGDVNTDWIVLAVEQEGEEQIIGLRDGRRMGYGERTNEIHDVLKGVFRRLAAAQYDVPSGLETYDELDRQFSLALPAGWVATHLSVVEIGGAPLGGTILFSAEPLPAGADDNEKRQRELAQLATVDTPTLLLDRSAATAGMRCSGFSASARRRVADRVREMEPFHAEWGESLGEVEVQDQSLDGCRGLRLVARGSRADGGAVVLDGWAVSDDETLFLFVLHAAADDYEDRRRAFERTLSTFRRSVARGP